MPIKPENRLRYPRNWKAIRRGILAEADYCCECRGECGSEPCASNATGSRCIELHGRKAAFANGKVVLTIAHLDHTPENCKRSNLRAMCQRCHLAYDAEHHRASRALPSKEKA